jgi:hypothetical protein
MRRAREAVALPTVDRCRPANPPSRKVPPSASNSKPHCQTIPQDGQDGLPAVPEIPIVRAILGFGFLHLMNAGTVTASETHLNFLYISLLRGVEHGWPR